jgi:hypothetical protein
MMMKEEFLEARRVILKLINKARNNFKKIKLK